MSTYLESARITKVRALHNLGHVVDTRKCTDHNNFFVPYFSADESETLDAIYTNDAEAIAGMYPSFLGIMNKYLNG